MKFKKRLSNHPGTVRFVPSYTNSVSKFAWEVIYIFYFNAKTVWNKHEEKENPTSLKNSKRKKKERKKYT